MTVALPTKPQTRAELGVTPKNARVFLAGTPKVGKTTLAASWVPEETLLIDTQMGTTLLEGEHFVAHVKNWPEFEQVVAQVVAGDHAFKTVMVDMIDDVWAFADAHFAGKGKAVATATDDYSRSAKNAEGRFRQVVGRLLSTDLGVWFLTHTKTVEEGSLTRYVAKLDSRVVTYIQGATQFVLLAEALGTRRLLHTAPSAKFEAGSRVPLPEPLELDARKLYAAIAEGLAATNGKPTKKEKA